MDIALKGAMVFAVFLATLLIYTNYTVEAEQTCVNRIHIINDAHGEEHLTYTVNKFIGFKDVISIQYIPWGINSQSTTVLIWYCDYDYEYKYGG